MTHFFDTRPLCESIDAGWDEDLDIRDLVQTTPLVYDADGLPVGYDAGQLFGFDDAYLGGRA